MPIALLIIGLLLVISAARGNVGQIGALLKSDFSGANNFFYWVAAVLFVGALGYYQPAQRVSRLFMILIMLVMILANKGFFSQLSQALSSAQAPAPAPESAVGAQVTDAGQGGAQAGAGAQTVVSGVTGAVTQNSQGNVLGSVGQTVQGAQSAFGQISGGVGQIQSGNVFGGLQSVFGGLNQKIPIPSFMGGN